MTESPQHADPSILAARLHAVRDTLALHGVDAAVVVHGPNIRYLTNFRASSAALVVAREQLYLVTDFRYSGAFSALQSARIVPSDVVLGVAAQSIDETLAAWIRERPGERVGVESRYLALSRYTWLVDAVSGGLSGLGGTPLPPADVLVPLGDVVEPSRTRKDPFELAILREAGRRISAVAARITTGVVRVGRREQDIAAEIDGLIAGAGFERPAFETIVASGPNGAFPHARPTPRTIRDGDLVIVDFGGVLSGYCVDVTRTIAAGRPSARLRRLHAAVLDAQRAAMTMAAPGVTAGAVDRAAREVLDRADLGRFFGHGTGHGLGLEVHEAPAITSLRPEAAAATLAAGMVFTLEPGVYVPDLGGVRIEDDVVLTAAGAEPITTAPRGLVPGDDA